MLPVEMSDSFVSSEVRVVLDEELGHLPERYRAAIVLCELEGLSRRQAAAQLGISEGTLSSRLARAKIQLRDRLTRRGVALSAAALGSLLAQDALAVVVPPTLADSTIQLATLISSGSSLAGIVSTPVATLIQGVLKAMLFAKVKSAVLGIATLALVTTGVGVLAQTGASPDDRLKAVERKLDKLLEVLGASNRPGHTPASLPVPAGASVPAMPPLASTPPPASPQPLAAVPPPPSSPATPLSGPTPDPFRAELPGPPGGTTPPRFQSRGRANTRSNPGQAQSLPGRLDTLEQRLDEFERRLGALEKRIQHASGSAAFSGTIPVIVESAPAGPAPPSADVSYIQTNPPSNNARDALHAPPTVDAGSPLNLPRSTDLYAPNPGANPPPSPPSAVPASETPR